MLEAVDNDEKGFPVIFYNCTYFSIFYILFFFVSFFISFLFSYFYLLLLSCHCNFVNNKHSLHISKRENLKVVYLFYVYQMIVTEKLYNIKWCSIYACVRFRHSSIGKNSIHLVS